MTAPGYPDGLRGDEIPLTAAILQLADVYDALTTDRPYRKASPSEDALQIMDDEANAADGGTGIYLIFPRDDHRESGRRCCAEIGKGGVLKPATESPRGPVQSKTSRIPVRNRSHPFARKVCGAWHAITLRLNSRIPGVDHETAAAQESDQRLTHFARELDREA